MSLAASTTRRIAVIHPPGPRIAAPFDLSCTTALSLTAPKDKLSAGCDKSRGNSEYANASILQPKSWGLPQSRAASFPKGGGVRRRARLRYLQLVGRLEGQRRWVSRADPWWRWICFLTLD